MSTPRAATALQRVEVVIACENCGRRYSYSHDLLGAARSLYGPAARGEAERRLADQVGQLRAGVFTDLPPRPCPHCGAIQTWMAPAARRRAAERWGCGASAAAASLGLLSLALAGRLAFDLVVLGSVLLGALALGALADRLARRHWRPPVPIADPGRAAPPEIRFL